MSQPRKLEIENLTASYSGALILDDVSLSVDTGETVGLVGRNGAGKTTLLHSLFGIPAVTGSIRIDGQPLKGGRKYEPASRGIALVPQGRKIISNLTVEENLLVGAAPRRPGRWDVEGVLELFPNLARARHRPGLSLSGGEQQMLAIGRSLMSNPQLLLMDEPTEGLAPVVIDEVKDVLRLIQAEGTGLLLVEQRIGVVEELASRFVALGKGGVVAEGPVARLNDRDVQELIAI